MGREVCVCVHICVFVIQEFVSDMLVKAKVLCVKVCVCVCVCVCLCACVYESSKLFKMSKKKKKKPCFEDTYPGSDPTHTQVRTQTLTHSYELGRIQYCICVCLHLCNLEAQSHFRWLHTGCKKTYRTSATKSPYTPTQTNIHYAGYLVLYFPQKRMWREHEGPRGECEGQDWHGEDTKKVGRNG